MDNVILKIIVELDKYKSDKYMFELINNILTILNMISTYPAKYDSSNVNIILKKYEKEIEHLRKLEIKYFNNTNAGIIDECRRIRISTNEIIRYVFLANRI